MQFSVLIIVKNRQRHLQNVLTGIESSLLQPQEIIVVHMNEPPRPVDSVLPVRQLEIRSDHPLPLAQARNAAAAQAKTDRLIFLDVDCIPTPDCFTTLLNDLENAKLVMADPQYLREPVDSIDFEQLAAKSQRNPARRDIRFGLSDQYEMFWSLGFAMRLTDFTVLSGFDENFVGYGGEDTDFSFSARRAGYSLFMSHANVYHQPHASYDPPLNWLEDIVTNALAFRQKWQVWPMQGWLQAFAALGYIAFDQDRLEIIKLPTKQEIEAARGPVA